MGFKSSNLQKHKKTILGKCQEEKKPLETDLNRIKYIENVQTHQQTQIVEEIHIYEEEDQALPEDIDRNVNLNTQIPNQTDESSDFDNRNIEEQVIHAYEKEINQLSIKDTLKDYLRRGLRTVVTANEDDKLLLLDIRQQLKQTSLESSRSAQGTEFLKFIDKLYFLALDKSFSHYSPNHTQRNFHFRHSMNPLNIARLSNREQLTNQVDRNPLHELLHSDSQSDENEEDEQTSHQQDPHQLRRNQGNSLFPNFLNHQRRELERLSQSLRWRIDQFQNNQDRSRINDQPETPANRDLFQDYLERWPSLVQYMSPSFFRLNNDTSNQDNQSQDNNQPS